MLKKSVLARLSQGRWRVMPCVTLCASPLFVSAGCQSLPCHSATCSPINIMLEVYYQRIQESKGVNQKEILRAEETKAPAFTGQWRDGRRAVHRSQAAARLNWSRTMKYYGGQASRKKGQQYSNSRHIIMHCQNTKNYKKLRAFAGVWEWGTGHIHQGTGIGMTRDFSGASWDAPRGRTVP